MAQRKSPPSGPTAKAGAAKASSGSRPGAAKAAGAKAAGAKAAGAKASGARASGARASGARAAGAKAPAGRPPNRKPGKSIVNQKQTPWGLIWTTVAVVVFAAAVVAAVVVTGNSDSGNGSQSSAGGQAVNAADPYRQPELAAAKKITGVTYRVEGQHNHLPGNIKYDSSPPVGGNHNAFWGDCTGTVYPKPIANENAVHMLEHGGLWITYNAKTLPAADLTTLKSYVSGVGGLALSPYPNLRTPISLQSWGYQLFVDKAADPRIQQFIALLKFNKKTTPEYGSSCSNPAFKAHPSTFGHPTNS